ncbi:MAG: biopolymer transporter ExbD [Fibrobacteria bacterium]|nr:biopolymer transporter ExbD [Fibrobacteria bacterium]
METLEITRKKRQGVNVDIAPLMDMVFILLIFFIVTSTFTRETGVEVEKPKAKTATELNKKSVLIAITREGTIHVNERQVEYAALKDILKQMLLRNPSREVVIISDKNSLTGRLVNVMDACNLAGVKKISVAAMTN